MRLTACKRNETGSRCARIAGATSSRIYLSCCVMVAWAILLQPLQTHRSAKQNQGGEEGKYNCHRERSGGKLLASSLDIHLHLVQPPPDPNWNISRYELLTASSRRSPNTACFKTTRHTSSDTFPSIRDNVSTPFKVQCFSSSGNFDERRP